MNKTLLALALVAPLPALALPGLSLEADAFGGATSIDAAGNGSGDGEGVEYGVRANLKLLGGPFADVQYTRHNPEDDAYGDGLNARIDEYRIGGGYAVSLPILPILTAGVYAHYVTQDIKLGGAGSGNSNGYDYGVLGRFDPLPFIGAYARVGRIDSDGYAGYGSDGLDSLLGVDLSVFPFLRLFVEYRYTEVRASDVKFDSHGVHGGLRFNL
ncbi:MAG: hypothetical protein C0434_02660 [Xanthomonadaceae bacterium]|nr:hypothetical protein [Xanthomonadaceae bacterium]